MRFGINGPYMSGTDRQTLLEWFRRVDDGPFHSIATGERVLFPQVEQQAFLAAAAAVTSRVRIVANIMVLPMHSPVLLAKRLASIDVISGGRLDVGIGAGGREDDYRAAGASFSNRWKAIDESVATMRRIWSGDLPWEGADPVGPLPVQLGGPPLYTAASGPTALPRSATWADGWLGAMMTCELEPMRAEVARHREAWETADRSEKPYMVNASWYYLGEDAEQTLNSAAVAYLGLPPGSPSPFGNLPLHNPDAIAKAVADCEQAGFDELMFIPLTDDLAQLDRLEAIIAPLAD
jgi:alkanesulfonate monooxygenase SsuD/methylene tetrahydromethanopterin reductase-like flavin-dependent oxidoreductase (luciferase family)